MKNLEKTNGNVKTIHLSHLEVPVPANTKLTQNANIQEAFQLYLEQHPEIITQILAISIQISESKPPKSPGKWAEAAQEFRENAMSKEAGIEMEKARQEFRETFAIGDTV